MQCAQICAHHTSIAIFGNLKWEPSTNEHSSSCPFTPNSTVCLGQKCALKYGTAIRELCNFWLFKTEPSANVHSPSQLVPSHKIQLSAWDKYVHTTQMYLQCNEIWHSYLRYVQCTQIWHGTQRCNALKLTVIWIRQTNVQSLAKKAPRLQWQMNLCEQVQS